MPANGAFLLEIRRAQLLQETRSLRSLLTRAEHDAQLLADINDCTRARGVVRRARVGMEAILRTAVSVHREPGHDTCWSDPREPESCGYCGVAINEPLPRSSALPKAS